MKRPYRGTCGSGSEVAGLIFVTLFAIQLLADPRCTSLGRQYPFTYAQWRVVPHMLVVAAGEFRHPVSFVVDLEIINYSVH